MAKVDIMEIEKIDRDRKTGDNMDGEKRADDKLEAGMKFRDFKNMPGKTITEKLQKAGIILDPAESKAFLKLYKKRN